MKELVTVNSDNVLATMQDAIKQKSDPAVIQSMMELIKFNDERNSRKSFNTAFTLAQSEFPPVIKYKSAHTSLYAPYEDIVSAIKPAMVANGLSFRHTQEQLPDKSIKITCTLSHKDGYSESTSMVAPPDNSGKKNAIQSIGSTDSYLKRYTLLAITGVATTDNIDTDGAYNGSDVEYINADQLLKIRECLGKLDKSGKKQAFVDWLRTAFKTNKIEYIKATDYEVVLDAMNKSLKVKSNEVNSSKG